MLNLIAFDADDTLWHNEIHYAQLSQVFSDLLEPFCSPQEAEKRLYETEVRNLPIYGYGTKPFMLSMIETAIDLSGSQISNRDIKKLIRLGQDMLSKEITLLPHVWETLRKLSPDYPLMVITKGDLVDQEGKLSRSGIAHCFQFIEIVSDKSPETYQTLLGKYGIEPNSFLMVGNSLKSDVLPVAALGAAAVHIPYEITWVHEVTGSPSPNGETYYKLEHMGQLPELIDNLQIYHNV